MALLQYLLDTPSEQYGLFTLGGRNWTHRPCSGNQLAHRFLVLFPQPRGVWSQACERSAKTQGDFEETPRAVFSVWLPPFQSSTPLLQDASASPDLHNLCLFSPARPMCSAWDPLLCSMVRTYIQTERQGNPRGLSFIFLLQGITAQCFLLKSGLISTVVLQGPQS